jgi:CDP-diacylglycerol---serine O-phosphatidyltransferase
MSVKQKLRSVRFYSRLGAFAPELVTSLGLLTGFYSLVFTINSHLGLGALLIEIALVFDWLDGLVARRLGSASRLGVEFDSLSDVTAFGVAPAGLVYIWALKPAGIWGATVSGLYVLCAALRLARFNIQVGSIRKSRFVGLPVPSAAAMIAGLALAYGRFEIGRPRLLWPIMVPVTLILACLMISRLPYPSFKLISLRRATLPTTIVIFTAVGFLLSEPRLAACLFPSIYVISGPVLLARGERIAADVPGLWQKEGARGSGPEQKSL